MLFDLGHVAKESWSQYCTKENAMWNILKNEHVKQHHQTNRNEPNKQTEKFDRRISKIDRMRSSYEGSISR